MFTFLKTLIIGIIRTPFHARCVKCGQHSLRCKCMFYVRDDGQINPELTDDDDDDAQACIDDIDRALDRNEHASEVASAEHDWAEALKYRVELEAQVEQLTDENGRLKHKLYLSQKSSQVACFKVFDLEEAGTSKSIRIEDLEEHLQRWMDENGVLKARVEDLEKMIGGLGNNTMCRVEDLEEMIEDLKAQVEVLKVQLDPYKAKIKSLTDKIKEESGI